MSLSQLDDDEKAALFYHLIYPTNSKKSHPELFGASTWLNSFYRRMGRGEDSLKKMGILDSHLTPTAHAYKMIPVSKARSILLELRNEMLRIDAERLEFEAVSNSLKIKVARLKLRPALDRVALPNQIKVYIDKAFQRIDDGSYSEAIMNCYRISEALVKNLFSVLYPEDKKKRIKHEDKLKRLWNDEQKEKNKQSGIKVIASLLSVVLWYRNKMAAHIEMTPTREAARTCTICLMQALIELNRLGVTISWPI